MKGFNPAWMSDYEAGYNDGLAEGQEMRGRLDTVISRLRDPQFVLLFAPHPQAQAVGQAVLSLLLRVRDGA